MNALTRNVTCHFNKKKDMEAIKSSATIMVPNGAPLRIQDAGGGGTGCLPPSYQPLQPHHGVL